MANVVYLLSSLKESGPVNQLYNTVTNLDRSAFDVTVATLSEATSDSMASEFVDAGANIFRFDSDGLMGLRSVGDELDKNFGETSSTVLHTHGFRADLVGAFAVDRLPTVATIHNYPFTDYRFAYGRVRGATMAAIHLAALAAIERPIACAAHISDRLPMLQPSYIRNGINTDTHRPPNEETERRELRTELGLPSDGAVVLTASPFIQRKNVEYVIDRFQRSALGEKTDVHLVMLGDGPLHGRCRRLVNDTNIFLPGFVDSVDPYLAVADCYVSASRDEGLAMGVLEALAYGVPVCLSDIPAHAEIVSLDRRIGELFSIDGEETFPNCLRSVLREDHAQRRRSARELAVSDLSASLMADRYETVYREVID